MNGHETEAGQRHEVDRIEKKMKIIDILKQEQIILEGVERGDCEKKKITNEESNADKVR